MILYSSRVSDFIEDINNNKITYILENMKQKELYEGTTISEKQSWENSLKYMSEILNQSNIPKDCTVSLEYNLPMTSSRIDFMLCGYDIENKKNVLIIELKQWSKVNRIEDSDILLETYVGNGLKKVVHPSYQAWTYKMLLKDFNQNIQENNIVVEACSILHNYIPNNDDPILDNKFTELIKEVPIFFQNDEEKIIEFINKKFSYGDNLSIIQEIDSSKLLPSKSLQENIDKLLKGNKEFKLIDNQMIIYDEILSAIKREEKNVIIVEGGPGTGKSVIAVNLLATLTNQGKLCQYVSRNTAPRVIYGTKLKGTLNKTSIDNLFKTSGAYTETDKDIFDVLIVDEAHCLTEKSGLFNNYGENQIKEIINSAKCSIFFIDEKQKVHLNDIGTKNEIKRWAANLNANIIEFKLESQFRCKGSDNYLKFIDYILGNTNNYVGKINYDIAVCDTPQELEALIKIKNAENNKSRIVAGYCWNWNKDEINNTDYHDIKIGDYGISWNLGAKQTFAIDDSINEAGCVHSVQGLEFDYVGVIIGEDMYFKDGKVCTDFQNHASSDPSFKGIKKMYKENEIMAREISDTIIKNTYRVLLTRGIKGCYIYCVNEELNNYFKEQINCIKKK